MVELSCEQQHPMCILLQVECVTVLKIHRKTVEKAISSCIIFTNKCSYKSRHNNSSENAKYTKRIHLDDTLSCGSKMPTTRFFFIHSRLHNNRMGFVCLSKMCCIQMKNANGNDVPQCSAMKFIGPIKCWSVRGTNIVSGTMNQTAFNWISLIEIKIDSVVWNEFFLGKTYTPFQHRSDKIRVSFCKCGGYNMRFGFMQLVFREKFSMWFSIAYYIEITSLFCLIEVDCNIETPEDTPV